LKLVQREQQKQTENFRKRLAERNKTRMNRSMTLKDIKGLGNVSQGFEGTSDTQS